MVAGLAGALLRSERRRPQLPRRGPRRPPGAAVAIVGARAGPPAARRGRCAPAGGRRHDRPEARRGERHGAATSASWIVSELERLIFGHRATLLVALRARHGRSMALVGVAPAGRRRIRQAAADPAPLHPDLPEAPAGVRRRQPGPGGDGRQERRHVHAGVLRRAAPRHRRGLLPARRRPRPRPVAVHAQRPLHRGGRGRHRRRQRHPRRLRADAEGLDAVRRNILKAGIVGRLVANDFSGAHDQRRAARGRPDDRRDASTPRASPTLLETKVRRAFDAEFVPGSPVTVHILGFAKVVGDIAAGARRVIALLRRRLRPDHGLLVCRLLPVAGGWRSWSSAARWSPSSGSSGSSRCSATASTRCRSSIPFLIFAIAVSHGVQMVSAARSEIFLDADSAVGRAHRLPAAARAGRHGAAHRHPRLPHSAGDPDPGHPRDLRRGEPRRGADPRSPTSSCCRSCSPTSAIRRTIAPGCSGARSTWSRSGGCWRRSPTPSRRR